MRIQSSALPITSVLYALPKTFPFHASGHWVQKDSPISWLHIHNCLEIGWCKKGAGVFMIGHHHYPFNTGSVNIIPAGIPHLARSVKGTVSEWYWFFLDPTKLILDPGIADLFSSAKIISRNDSPAISALLKSIVEESSRRKINWRPAVRAYLTLVATQLKRNFILPYGKTSHSLSDCEEILPALNTIVSSYQEPLTISRLAATCKMSPAHFNRRFRAVTGQSPYNQLMNFRIRMAAAQLQESDARVLDIALECGYPTLSSFNRHFQRTYRTSPLKWRKRTATAS